MSEFSNIIYLFALTAILVIITSFFIGYAYSIPQGNVALINIQGEIVSFSDLLSSGVTSDDIINSLKEAESNPNVEAVILSINSPGGMVVASKEVAEYILSMNKTVVAWIRELGASGAYLIAAASDYIVCDELSITGSIGVSSSYLAYTGLLDKYGVDYVRLVTGEYKDMGTEYRNLTDSERVLLMDLIGESFDYFLNFVSRERNISLYNLSFVSDGRILSGTQAYNLGLVDELGGRPIVDNYLYSLGFEYLEVDDYSPSNDALGDFSGLLGFSSALSLPTYS